MISHVGRLNKSKGLTPDLSTTTMPTTNLNRVQSTIITEYKIQVYYISYLELLHMIIFIHWLFSYPVICPLLYVNGYWIGLHQEVSDFELSHYEHCYTLIVLLPCNVSTALCTWILKWVLSACKLFWTPHYEHCYTLIVILPCNVSISLCTWILNWVPSACKLFWTPHYEHCYTLIVILPCNVSTSLRSWILKWVPSGCKLF